MTLSMWEQEKFEDGETRGILKTLAGLVRDGFISVVWMLRHGLGGLRKFAEWDRECNKK